MKDNILAIIKNKPKHYSKIIKKDKEMHDWVTANSLIESTKFAEMIYSAVHQESNICQNNKTKKFKSMKDGYGYCGHASVCQCNKEISAIKTSKAKHEYTLTRKKQINDLRADTMLSQYGAKYNHQREDYSAIVEKNSILNHGVRHFNQRHIAPDITEILNSADKFKDFAKEKTRAYVAYELGVDYTVIKSYESKYECSDVFSAHTRSKWEDIIQDFLVENKVRFESSSRKIIPPLELDFYLPDFNIAIEINGNYWHSEIGGKKDKRYHHNKWLRCREQGIDLYSYFEDELINNIDIVKNKIKYLVNNNKKVIGARKIAIGKVMAANERAFLNVYHIQGRQGSRNKTLGAYYDGDLVAVFSWLQRKQYLEITRYACDSKASYPGLFSKMMKHMIDELKYIGQVVSFSNNGHSNGGVYKASGFKIDKILGGAYWYSDNYLQRENRQSYMKGDIIKKFNDPRFREDNKKEWTEWQAMQALGYDRIWDSGKIKWIKVV